MTDAALAAFVQWCRAYPDVEPDAYVVRRVFAAYDGLDDEVRDHLCGTGD